MLFRSTLNLTVNVPTSSTTNASICQGSSYTFNGTTYITSGTYTKTLINAAGCDSIATLNLTVNVPTSSTTNASICQGGSYVFNGSTYNVAGTYSRTLINAAGCDSIATLHLTVNASTSSTTSGSICQGSSYTFNGSTYTGAAPIRMLTFAEYNFIRAEAALRFASPGSAQTFFEAGIRASMESAGVAAADITTYLAANGTLSGSAAQQLEQIINEKYVANYGVVMEPWTDFRRTGYPALTLPSNAIVPYFPRSLFYPQSELDLNPENVTQKKDMSVRVFWDKRP